MFIWFMNLNEQQRRVLGGLFGLLFFVFLLMLFSKGKKSDNLHPDDLDLTFEFDDKTQSLNVHFFKTPTYASADQVLRGYGKKNAELDTKHMALSVDNPGSPSAGSLDALKTSSQFGGDDLLMSLSRRRASFLPNQIKQKLDRIYADTDNR